MFGERYFEVRSRLADVVIGIQGLGEEVGAPLEGFLTHADLLHGLKNPFLFVTCGEVNAGKSSFINGFLGEELCAANVLPETNQVQWYRYGEEAKDVSVTPTLQERYRSTEFLKDFNIVDTPGTNSIVAGHQAITERFLPVADLVLFVFPVNNPWGAATWDLIERFPEELKNKTALILAQKDLRDHRDVETIIKHMKQLAQKRFGFVPPVLAVSSLQALKAYQPDGGRDRSLWSRSGYEALEEFISDSVTESESRRKSLEEVRDLANESLGEVEKKMEQFTQGADRKILFLSELEKEMTSGKEAHANLFKEKFSGMAEVFENQVEKAALDLKKQTGVLAALSSLLRVNGTSSKIEHSLVSAVQEAVRERAVIDAEELTKGCRDHWRSAQPRVKQEVDVELADFDQAAKGNFKGVKDQFMSRLGDSAQQAVIMQKLKPFLDRELGERRVALRNKVSMALLSIAAGFFLSGMQLQPWGIGALVLGVLLFVWGLIQTQRKGNQLVQGFLEKGRACKEPFAEALAGEYREGVGEFFAEYGSLYAKVRQKIAQEKESLKPRLQRWRDLFVELKAIEQEI